MEDLSFLINTYPEKVRIILLKYNILKEPSILSVASAYALYGESFKIDLYNELFGTVNFYREPQSAAEPEQAKSKRKINWQKWGDNLNKSLDFLSKAVPVAGGIYNIAKGNVESTKVGYSNSEYGYTIENRISQQKESMFLIAGVVVLLLVAYLFLK